MDDDLLVFDDVFAEAVDELFVRRCAVEARCDEDRYIDRGIGLADAAQKNGHCYAAWYGARVIARDDNHAVLALDKFLEFGAANGIVKRAFDDFLLRARLLFAFGVRLKYAKEVFVWNVDFHLAFAVGNFQLHYSTLLYCWYR